MIGILRLIVLILGFILVFSAYVGAVRFFKDLHIFKSELHFSGSRKQLIDFLIENERGGKNADKQR